MLSFAIISIASALVLYTAGVWSEKLQKVLKPWHVTIFWLGFICDTTGTALMSYIAEGSSPINFYGITSGIAIFLMLAHAIWATVVFMRKQENLMHTFHKFSLIVWIIWLIPYLLGMIAGLNISIGICIESLIKGTVNLLTK